MNNQNLHIKRQLEEMEELGSEVARLRRGVQHLESRCRSAGISRYGKTPAGGGQGEEDLWIRLCDQREALAEKEADYRAKESCLHACINRLPKPRWRMVLRYRYLEGMPMAEISEVLTEATGHSFSVSQVYRLHAQALRAAEDLWPVS